MGVYIKIGVKHLKNVAVLEVLFVCHIIKDKDLEEMCIFIALSVLFKSEINNTMQLNCCGRKFNHGFIICNY